MSRPPKEGIDFAGWSVNLFDGDKKIDKLLDAHGWKGFGIYFFLCQSAYKINGYFLEWGYDDCASTARRMGGGVVSSTVEETVRFCLQVGLFDQGLFDRWNVLTSKGIQRRFWIAVRYRKAIPLHKAYWLLAPEETEGLDKVARYVDSPPAKPDSPPVKPDSPPANGYKRKVNKSKGNESKGPVAPQSAAQGESSEGDNPFSGELGNAFSEWLEYKKEKRQTYQPRGLKTLVSQIERYSKQFGDEATANAIRDSMANNYQGIVFDRIGNIPHCRERQDSRNFPGYVHGGLKS